MKFPWALLIYTNNKYCFSYFSDLLQNPLLVPVKILHGHDGFRSLGVLDCQFHPTQPWLFSSGADSTIRLFTWGNTTNKVDICLRILFFYTNTGDFFILDMAL